jgi:ribosomal protein S18 acetylase RimI-like enzyme
MRADDVVPLAHSLGWPVEGIDHRWRELESGEREMLVAEVEGRPGGSVSMNVHDDVPGLIHLFALDVAPAQQRRGIGTALIQRVEEHAVSRGMAGVWLDVEIVNEDARRLYERLGYMVEGDVVVNRYTAYPSGEKVEEVCHRMFKRLGRMD